MPIKRLKRIEDATMFVPLNEEGRSQWWSGSYKGDITGCLRIDREDNYIPLGEEFRFERSDRSCNYSGEERVLVARGREDNSVEIIAMDTIIGPDTAAVALPEKYGKIRNLSRKEMAEIVSVAARRDRAGREGFAHMRFRTSVTVFVEVYKDEAGSYKAGWTQWDRAFSVVIRGGTSRSVFQRYLCRLERDVLATARRAKGKRDHVKITVKGSFGVYGESAKLTSEVDVPDTSILDKIRGIVAQVKKLAEPFFD